MNKITEHNLINLIKEKFPKFIPYWDEYIDSYGSDQGLTIQIYPFIDYVVDVLKSENKKQIEIIFNFVELLMCEGDESVQNTIATSFLESLLSSDPDEIQFIKFRQYLGQETIAYCRTWDVFTGVMTKGLHDDSVS